LTLCQKCYSELFVFHFNIAPTTFKLNLKKTENLFFDIQVSNTLFSKISRDRVRILSKRTRDSRASASQRVSSIPPKYSSISGA
jgi:hypothetical protein